MHAATERQVAVDLAVEADVESASRTPPGRGSPRRALHRHQGPWHRATAQRGVARRDAEDIGDWRLPTEELLDRVRDDGRVRGDRMAVLGVLGEECERARQRVGHGVEPSIRNRKQTSRISSACQSRRRSRHVDGTG